MVLYHNMLIVSIFKIERVHHFLVAWLLECSAPSTRCHHRPDTTPRRYEAGRYKDEAGIQGGAGDHERGPIPLALKHDPRHVITRFFWINFTMLDFINDLVISG